MAWDTSPNISLINLLKRSRVHKNEKMSKLRRGGIFQRLWSLQLRVHFDLPSTVRVLLNISILLVSLPLKHPDVFENSQG